MKIYKITEASEYLGVSINTLKTLANNGKINSFKTTGSHRRFRQEDLDVFMGIEKEKQELDAILHSHVPELSESDWQEILNIQNGAFIELRPSFRLASDMMDYYGAVSVESLSPEQADLAKRLHVMPQIQQAAILWVCRNFWSRQRDEGSLMDMVNAAIQGQ